MRRNGRTLEGTAIGTLDRDVEVSEIIFVRRCRNSWCGIGYKSFSLLKYIKISSIDGQKGNEVVWAAVRTGKFTLMIRCDPKEDSEAVRHLAEMGD